MIHRILCRGFLLISLTFPFFPLNAQSTEFTTVPPGLIWTVTTRMDYRVRVDGRYQGHADRELREVYRLGAQVPAGWEISGTARLLGATMQDGLPVAARLQDSEEVFFTVMHDGSVTDAGDGFPSLRGFPTFPREAVNPGDTWEAHLEVLVIDPQGRRILLPQIAVYKYLGRGISNGIPTHDIEVAYAVRYSGGNPDADHILREVEGAHRVGLALDRDFRPLMARDNLRERWVWANGTVEEREGFSLTFWGGVPPLDRSGLRQDLVDGFDPGEDVLVEETPEGVQLTLRNLHFVADQAVILDEDRPLLNHLAQILGGVGDRSILVIGHTADVGRPDDEQTLSEERARTVADALANRGIDPRRLAYAGMGGREPVASNDNEEGRRLNRRVEILILED